MTKPLTRLPLLGPIVWLYQQSPFHKHLFISDLEWLVMPPLMTDQCKLFTKDDAPVAFASWAFVSEEVEQRILSRQFRIAPQDWRSGDRLLLIDLLSPFGGNDALLKDLSRHVFPNTELRVLRTPDGNAPRIETYPPTEP